MGLMSALGLIAVKIENLAALKAKGKIIVANHPSLIDVVILISYIPNADCIVKSSLGNNFFMRGVIKAAGYIPNSTNLEELLSACSSSLKKGNNLIIFPEGTRSVPGKQTRISRGAAHIAVHSGCDILPIRINCYPPGLLKNQKWYKVADEKMKYVLKVKPVLGMKEYARIERSLAVRRLTAELEKRLAGSES